MKWLPINAFLLLFITTTGVMINCRVEGARYQRDQSSKGIDNNDNLGPANYRFEYGIDDGNVGPQFGHEEERNGVVTRGRYTVLLPDGRLQVVTYRADENGYKADVTYENGSGGGDGGGGTTSSSGSSGGGYTNNAAGTSSSSEGGYNYESVQTSASSYGPPEPPTQSDNGRENSGRSSYQGGSGSPLSSNRGNSRNFVKLRRTVEGKTFNYAY